MDDVTHTFYPTVAFGFSEKSGKSTLHQLWVDQLGNIEWRPVPTIIEGKLPDLKPSIVGYVPEEDENAPD